MGRQLRRVPLDFDWPLNETWNGFLNPWYKYSHKCVACGGSGYSPQAKIFSDQWYGNAPFDPAAYGVPQLAIDDYHFRETIIAKIRRQDELVEQGHDKENYYTRGYDTFDDAVDHEVCRMWNLIKGQWYHHLSQDDVDALVAAGRLYDFTRHFVPDEGWVPNDPPTVPTAAEVNAWSLSGMAHDAINCWACVRARCEREGVPVGCSECDGDGSHWDSAEAKESCENWQEEEPPTGDGYQLWETVSEGSPITPVCATSRELAEWLVQHDDSVTKDTTFDQWMRFIEGEGWAPSMIGTNGRLQSGTKAIGTKPG